MSVNLSRVRQRRDQALVSDVASASVRSPGLPPSAPGARAHRERARGRRTLHSGATGRHRCERSAGPAIDDSGTGYSSLRYIKQFPVRELKIDESFVSVLGDVADDSTLVALIIDLARSLQMSTVAEGIETNSS